MYAIKMVTKLIYLTPKTGKPMSYNEYMVEYLNDKKETKFKFIDASSPVNAGDKVCELPECVKLVEVVLCDPKFWSLG